MIEFHKKLGILIMNINNIKQGSLNNWLTIAGQYDNQRQVWSSSKTANKPYLYLNQAAGNFQQQVFIEENPSNLSINDKKLTVIEISQLVHRDVINIEYDPSKINESNTNLMKLRGVFNWILVDLKKKEQAQSASLPSFFLTTIQKIINLIKGIGWVSDVEFKLKQIEQDIFSLKQLEAKLSVLLKEEQNNQLWKVKINSIDKLKADIEKIKTKVNDRIEASSSVHEVDFYFSNLDERLKELKDSKQEFDSKYKELELIESKLSIILSDLKGFDIE